MNRGSSSLLISEHHRVKLNLAHLTVDIHSLGQAVGFPSVGVSGEFLEGIDIPGEDGFEEWLREQRRIFRPISTASVGTAVMQQTALPQSELLAGQSPLAPRFVDRPALAVLPFANLTGDSGIDHLCEGLSEDLIDRLSRLRWLPVIARNSSFAFAAGSADVRTICRQLGARYVLEGRMRPATRDYSIALNLSDATNGLTFWSDRLPVPRDQAQDALDPVVANLVGVLDAQIDQAEQLRARGNRQNAVAFNDLIWRGRWHLNRLSRSDSEAAGRLFRQALELDPDSPEALVQVTYQLAWSLWARRAVGDEIVELRRLAHRAMAADPYDGRAFMLAGTAEAWMRRPDEARALIDRAIALNPSLSHAHAQVGSISNLTGDPAAAIAPLRMAQRLSPHDNYVFFIIGELAMTYWMLGQWPEAIAEANQALVRRPAYWYAAVVKINSLLGLGDGAAARRALDDLLAVKPGFRPDFIEWTPFVDRKWNQRLRDAVERMMGERIVPLGPRRASSRGRV